MTDAERIPHYVELAWKFRGHARRAEDAERRKDMLWHARFCIREARDARDRLGREERKAAA